MKKGNLVISNPDVLSSEKTSGKIGHVIQSDWLKKMARCTRVNHFGAISNLCFAIA